MGFNLPDFIQWCITNILHIDLVITIAVFIFILYARRREIYYAKDNKDNSAISWHWKKVRTIVLWGIFVMVSLLYHFSA